MSTLVQHVVTALRQGSAERHLALNLEFWDGHRESLGGPARVTVRLNRPEAARRLLRPDLGALGRAYVEGEIDVIGPAQEVVRLAVELSRGLVRERLLPWFAGWPGRHSMASDQRAIAHHYDVSNEFYQLWLDRAMVYSCAYFRDGDESLDDAQQNKLDLICRKLQLRPGEQLLDIGCGWGALLFWAQRHYGVKAVGVTLSTRQYEHVRDRIAQLGLAGQVEVRLQDYRQIPGAERFDKIASVGMFEHVGLKNLPVYFATIHRLLKRGGLVLNHGITTTSGDAAVREGGGEFIDRYVFPDGELPELSRALAEMAGQQLEVFDVEGLRPHYAQTLMHWVTRLEAQREEAIRLVGEKTYRVWRIYMAGSAHAFENGWISVYQLLAAKGGGPGYTAQAWNRAHMLQAAPKAAAPAARPRWPAAGTGLNAP